MTQKHTPGPWPMHIRHVHGTRDSDEMSGLGWDFDDDLNPPTPQLRGVLSKAADAKLVERTHEVPHDCDIPNCPGPVNKRKLEAFDDLLAACLAVTNLLQATIVKYVDNGTILTNGEWDLVGQAHTVIAKAASLQAR